MKEMVTKSKRKKAVSSLHSCDPHPVASCKLRHNSSLPRCHADLKLARNFF